MANVEMTLSVKVSWWVSPYMALIGAISRFISPVTPDRLTSAFIEWQVDFLTRRGIRFYSDGKRI